MDKKSEKKVQNGGKSAGSKKRKKNEDKRKGNTELNEDSQVLNEGNQVPNESSHIPNGGGLIQVGKGEENEVPKAGTAQSSVNRIRGKVCPYLRTINRNLLDFDFEKLCSISLSNLHVYACLVCGLYFQGIGKGTYAYTHALEANHYVFINLETCKTCCVPDNYEIEDASLNDIKYFLKPVYKRDEVEYLCHNLILGKSLDGADFFPGCVGLNNLKHTDYCNVIIQLLCCIIPIRNVLLLYENKQNIAKNLIIVLSELIKKIYNPKNFKGVVSPHEFLQAVGIESKKSFKIGTKNDPLDFFLWIISKIHNHSEKTSKKRKKRETIGINSNRVLSPNWGEVQKMGHRADDMENMKRDEKTGRIKEQKSHANGPSENNANNTEGNEKGKVEKKKKKSKWMYDHVNIIDYCFDGELIIKTKKGKDLEVEESRKENNAQNGDNSQEEGKSQHVQGRNKKETHDGNMLGEEAMSEDMSGDDDDDELNEGKNYIIQKIPFRTLSLKLPNPPIFKSTTESNIIPQVSIFELLTKYDGETETYLRNKSVPSTLTIAKLPKYLIFSINRFSKNNFFMEKNGTIVNFVIRNLDMKDYVHQDYVHLNPVTKYNLIANIFHSGSVNAGSYKIHVLHQPTNEWYEIEDLHVISILPQLVLLPESCVQLYQRQDVQLNGEIA
ncbi:U4/U6.U5 tri-snRNP-associated protein 2, putative [Plasmodium ovale]|uniref:U4/U6.U5 tri-snRNP-associated protein 2, putative n=2 Tax=Plasmodium ovale TaxID=36330 RepID=A0A1D3U9R5_PLAOA|nr:U4/U6.U5 tri-snRNP-associated protein 2, putative (USP39) [Plasmodium ovale curtisi]SBS98052.1 U4/U6.U5 tri-snRNP-associated protein 2, putative (USP39) [Plasmodium ovale curtisi]SCQ16812.1 U4/U6.U5 tri-snRNP-associated protein 2, putative [Plasmodium ovale]